MATEVRKLESFIQDFLKEIEENNAAVFAGAGLSVASGHVDWKGLLKQFADELDLDIEKEDDLISLAQYHLNKNANNRHALTQKIANEFHLGKKPNENHQILARLPINTWWTTNYDRLIEKSLHDVGKIADVKYTTRQLANTIHGRDCIVYKMHGDVENADEAILTKDQYEKYFTTHGAFINALSGDLISKTFLFIGFSFTDPNLEYILSRVRVIFQQNQRRHYCFFREVKKSDKETENDYEYRKIKQALIINDLLRFNIHVLLVEEYSDITKILKDIENRYKRKTIYISGSAYEYGKLGSEKAEKFISDLSRKLVNKGFKIISGFGLGVGSFVINGVLEEVYFNKNEKLKDQLLLRPFPQGDRGKQQWENYRNDMISYAGVALFIFGNKMEGGEVILAGGVKREFEIAREKKMALIPIGATGYIAKELWDTVLSEFTKYFPSENLLDLFKKLGDETLSMDEIVDSVLSLVIALTK